YNLQTYLAENIDLIWDEKLNISRGISDALTYCHGLNILHYDIRTNNVLLDHNLQPKLYNFRIVKESPVVLISENSPIDDYRYSSPERIRGEAYTTASEVYSFAMVMWEIQHHQLPYSNSTPEQINSKILADEKPELEPKVGTPVEYQRIIEEAWSYAPEKRPRMSSIFSRLDVLDSSYLFGLKVIELIGSKQEENE
ncbi:28308_t:CDS:2, partial [Dentiscutata erythropus]